MVNKFVLESTVLTLARDMCREELKSEAYTLGTMTSLRHRLGRTQAVNDTGAKTSDMGGVLANGSLHWPF